MNQDEIQDIRERMQSAAKYPHQWTKRVTIKKMAEYLEAVHPELHVVLNESSIYKDTHYARSRLRSPGTREYTGYKLKVWKSLEDRKAYPRYGTIIDHDTTETYRQNYEVAKAIIRYEERLKIPKCPECKDNEHVMWSEIHKEYDCGRCSRSFGG